MSQVAIEIKERCSNEKGKKLRRIGEIPGIVYGEFLDKPIPIKIKNSSLLNLLKENSKGSIIELKLKDKINNYVVKSLQKDAITGEIIHVDFQYVKKNEVIKMKIPVNYSGIETLQSKKLVLETYLSEIEMQGDVEKIPEYIKIDVSNLNFDDKLFVSDVKLPEEVRLITEADTLIAVVNG